MKKLFGIAKTAAAALGLLLFAACANILEPPAKQEPAGGKGLVYIGTGAGAPRTARPDAIFDHYVYLFSKDGGPDTPMQPSDEEQGALFELDMGNWKVTVGAFAESGEESLAAEGSETFTVSGGEETQVTVKLHPVASEGTGTLKYSLKYPDGAGVIAFTLTLLAGDAGVDLAGDSGTLEIASGYYLARAKLEKTKEGTPLWERARIPAEKTEVVHIFKNMTTELELEFFEPDFRAFVVVSSADSGPGTLRQALTEAVAGVGGTIVIALPPEDRVITLNSGLPSISSKSLTIEGGGATLTFAPGVSGRFLSIGSYITFVDIRRLHFKGGRVAGNGGAISNDGMLTLESCIFSNNYASGDGGAIYSAAATYTTYLTVSGCTFYGNSSGGSDGSLSSPSGAARLTGNLVWEHTEPATPTPVSPVSFRPIADGSALGAIPDRPAEYPLIDFYGDPVPATNAAAGAVQVPITGGSFLDYVALGPGTVGVTAGTVDSDGIIDGSVTLRAQESVNGEFRYWIVDGAEEPEQSPPNQLVVTLSGDPAYKTVRAVFYTKVTSAADSGQGSLREALATTSDGGGIILAGQTIILASPLSAINMNMVIEGNGATLTQSGFVPGSATQLVRVSSVAQVRVSRLHFKGGRATGAGGAVNNSGNLTLESCVFSDNQAYYGGAIYNSGSLTVSGCTFYGNSAVSYGGAVYQTGASSSLALTGNVLQKNTAGISSPVVYKAGGNVASGGFNVSDKAGGTTDTASGWAFTGNDKGAASLLLSPLRFRPLGGGDVPGVITEKPADYPALDFYGVPIPEQNAAAGAVQTPTEGGYFLDHAALGPGMVTVSVGTVDADGVINAGSSVTLTASTDAGVGEFACWLVGGEEQPEQSPPEELTVTMNAHKTVRAMFHSRVSNGLDSGAGSLRQALISAADGSRLIFNEGLTVTLLSPLDGIAKNLVIEGNGATLTQSGFTPSAITQLLRITGGQVRISRLHFKGGRTTTYGGAVYTAASGDLTLESCIFSDNRATGSTSTAQGGAVYAAGNLTVLGCTFYGNSAGTQGGAISRGGTSFLTLTGNVFWGNTAPTYPVLYTSSATGFTSGGFNVSDKAGGTETSASGWAFTNGDKPAAVQILSSVSFRPIGGGEALGVITEKPADYPALDFHGELIPETSAAAGAVQTPTGSGGYILDYAAQGPGQILVSGGTPDSDGLLSGSVTLTASAGEFAYWTVDGAKQPDQSPPEELALTMDAHKIVRAVFYNIKVANTNDSGPGTLRQALADAADGDRIGLSAGQTIALTSARLEANKNLIIEGNGATLTQDGFTASSTSQLLYIASGKEVRISRLHFKGGRATESAGAIYNNGGKLTLESCIFSDNQASDFLAGGAINTSGASATLTVLGCTFYANKATATSSSTAAGAIRKLTGTATLTGNVFFGNTAPSRPVVYASSGLTSGGYNVSDKAGGTGTSASGWNFTNGDVNPADLSVDSDAFQPSSASLPVIASPPAGFPTVYFDGTVRKTSGAASAPGAMPAALAAE